MKVLELFAGSRSVGKVAQEMGFEVFSTDINPFDGINLVADILEFDVSQVPFVPDIIWASPPCTFFSVASIGHHWNTDHTPKTENAVLGVRIVEKTLEIIRHFVQLNPNLVWFMENPRGKLRKLPVVAELDRETVMYCQYGDTRMKPTDIWTNSVSWIPRELCYNGNTNCHHQPAPRGSRTGTQGIIGSYDRSRIPEELVKEILESV